MRRTIRHSAIFPEDKPRIGAAVRETFRAGYRAADLRSDLLAGFSVGLVALPLSMALAIATGVPPQHGLYTTIIAGAVIALAGGCRVQISGPTASVVVLAPIAQEHGLAGLCIASAMGGLILIAMGFLRLGQWIRLVPYPVTKGFTFGIAIVIAVGQLPDFLGLSAQGLDPHPLPRLVALMPQLSAVRTGDAVIGLFALLVLAICQRYRTKLPGPLIALGLASLAVPLVQLLLPGQSVTTIGDRFQWIDAAGIVQRGVPSGLPPFTWPWDWPGPLGHPVVFDWQEIRALAPLAFTLAMLAAIESLLSATVADGLTGHRSEPDAELVGQGLGNLLAPFFGGFAATGATSRTVSNVRFGAKSPFAALAHVAFIVLAMVALTDVLAYLPMSALAAVLMMVAWNMAQVRHVAHVLKIAPRADVAVLLTCLGLTIVLDMVIAVAAGIVLASLLFMGRMAELTKVQIVEPSSGNESDAPAGVMVYRVDGPLFFGAAEKAMSVISKTRGRMRCLVLDLEAVPEIDATGIVNLSSTLERLALDRVPVLLAGLPREPHRALVRAGIRFEAGRCEVHLTVAAALARARELCPPEALLEPPTKTSPKA